jgi:hypothetical protein
VPNYTVRGKIVDIEVDANKPRFTINLADRVLIATDDPNPPTEVVADHFCAAKEDEEGPHVDKTLNYDALFSLALWCASNGVRINVFTDGVISDKQHKTVQITGLQTASSL